MKKIVITLLLILFTPTAVIACDATILPKTSYIVISPVPIKTCVIENQNILTGQVLSSIFGEKNQLVLKTKNVGKSKITINDKTYRIEVSKEQQQEWNIQNLSCLEIDNPPKNRKEEGND